MTPTAAFPVRMIGAAREWAALPARTARNVKVAEVRRLAEMHATIGGGGRLRMPSLDVVPWAWPTSAAGDVAFVRPAGTWTVEVTAAVAYLGDDDLLRRLLVDAFVSCIRSCVRAVYRCPDDDAGGVTSLGEPSLWLSDADADHYLNRYRWRGLLAAAADCYRATWLVQRLPLKVPGDPVIRKADVPAEVAARIWSLAGRPAPSARRIRTDEQSAPPYVSVTLARPARATRPPDAEIVALERS